MSIIWGQERILSRRLINENLENNFMVYFFLYMVRKGLFDCFENIARDLSTAISVYRFIKIYQFLENGNTIFEKI